MRTRQRGVEFQSFLGRRIRLGYEVIRIAGVAGQHAIGVRQSCIGQRVAGIFIDGLIEVGNRGLDVVDRSLGPVIVSVYVKLVSVRILRTRRADRTLTPTP